MDTKNIYQEIALSIPTVLLPKAGTDLKKWAVVACDQFTSKPEYWEKVTKLVGDDPSTLNLIFPEAYLETVDRTAFIEKINQTMKRYLDEGVLVEQKPGLVAIDRQTSHAASRKGLIVALDLENYSYEKGSDTLIRATEGTILDRLPPRIAIRENAPIELPHIMVLIDDPTRSAIEPLFEENLPLLYDTELMMDGGRIKGYQVSEPALIEKVTNALTKLADPTVFNEKYGLRDQSPMLYAMGDGNHSFATAKAIWEKLKSEATDKDAIMSHPARFALVELVNVHDAGLNFEPIHRVLFNVDGQHLLDGLKSYFEAQGSTVEVEAVDEPKQVVGSLDDPQTEIQTIPYVAGDKGGLIKISQAKLNLPVANLQAFLDKYLADNPKVKVDYIHGAETVLELGQKTDNIGFFLPVIAKSELFKTVVLDGALPRKAFSMGEAEEKRYYFECRKIQS
jgi:uncharacterized protein (DUF1015 family)